MLKNDSGSLSIRIDDTWFCLEFPQRGWISVILLQFLDDVMAADDRRTAVLRLLGYTLQLRSEPLPRWTEHWVEVDLSQRRLETNSSMMRAVVGRGGRQGPWSPEDLRRVHQTLDALDFTVRLS